MSEALSDVTEQELQGLYTWVDEIPLSRPKRNIARDFSDGVLTAEVVHHYFPKLVELHNYSSANATTQKMYNWNTLNQRVFKRLGFSVSKADFEAVANCQPGAIERILKLLSLKVKQFKEDGHVGVSSSGSLPGAPQASSPPKGQPRPALAMAGAYVHQSAGADSMAAMHRAAAQAMGPGHASNGRALAGVPPEVLAERDEALREMRETNEILETKVRKLEQLVRLKDAKIATLAAKLQAAGLS